MIEGQKKERTVYTVKEAAELLGVNHATIRRRIQREDIKAELVKGKTGQQWYIDEEELCKQPEFKDNNIAKIIPFHGQPGMDQQQAELMNFLLQHCVKPILESQQNQFQLMQQQSESVESLKEEVRLLQNQLDKQEESQREFYLQQTDRDVMVVNQMRGILEERQQNSSKRSFFGRLFSRKIRQPKEHQSETTEG